MRKMGAPIQRRRRGRLTRTCALTSCGKTFETVRSQVDRGNGLYCSRACYGRAKRTPMDESGRVCTRCKMWKLAEAFGENPQRPGRLRAHCDPCRRKYEQERKDRDPERAIRLRRRQLLVAYGMTLDDYERMLAEQNDACLICGTDQPGIGRLRFVVDHCHATGRVRGLLCNSCNSGLGYFSDNPSLLASAIKYLARQSAS